MPIGPNGEWRPSDPVECAVMVAKIATGEIEEKISVEHKPKSAEFAKAKAEKK